MLTPSYPTAPSPEILEAMIQGERDVIEQLVESDPKYAAYVRRHRARRSGEPMGPKAFYEARDRLTQLYAWTKAPLAGERIDNMKVGRALRIREIYRLEYELVVE